MFTIKFINVLKFFIWPLLDMYHVTGIEKNKNCVQRFSYSDVHCEVIYNYNIQK